MNMPFYWYGISTQFCSGQKFSGFGFYETHNLQIITKYYFVEQTADKGRLVLLDIYRIFCFFFVVKMLDGIFQTLNS
jgi:hypothetical protein